MRLRNVSNVGKAFEVLSSPAVNISFSQFGEDSVVLSILQCRKNLDKRGFYVDVGAHHPWNFSNTALLHHYKGWTGVNIDANEQAIEEFNSVRPRDINICAAISDEEVEAEYAMFNRPGVNTLDLNVRNTQANAAHGAYQIEKIVPMSTRRLDNLLDEVVPKNKKIDFMTVDIEGFDLKALKSNNWEKYRPDVLAVETHGMNLSNAANNPIYHYMIENGYRLASHCFVTSIFTVD